MFSKITNAPCPYEDYTDKKIIAICKNEFEFFFKKANVVGVGLGFKFTKDINLRKLCIKVFVTTKAPLCDLNPLDVVPTVYKGHLTDVVDSGIFEASSLNKRVRPVTGGYSIGIGGPVNGGTLGCVVADSNNKLYILSNNHVLASNSFPLLTPIIQPSYNSGGKLPTDLIAYLSNYIPLSPITPTSTPINLVDCAIAELSEPNIVSPFITFIGLPTGVNTPHLNELVKKVGRVTELTYGIVQSIHTTLKVTIFQTDQYIMLNQIVTNLMSKKGDSGSVLLNNNDEVLGLLMSASLIHTTYNTITDVLSALKVQIVTS